MGRPTSGPNGPRGICYQNLAEGRCIPILRLPVFDTTPPGVGGLTETATKARHGNFTPPRISPSCPHENGWTGVSLLPDGIIAKQLVHLFCGRMGTARHLTLAVFYAGNPAQVGLGASSRVASRWCGPSGNVFQSPDVTGQDPVFFKVQRSSSKENRTNKEKQPVLPL